MQPIQAATVPPFDIDFTDLYLPNMSGYEVLRSLRASKVKTPILIVTGRSGIEDPQTIPDIIVSTGGSLRVYECKAITGDPSIFRDQTTGPSAIVSIVNALLEKPKADDPLREYEQYSHANWDGHDAEPITAETLSYARWLLGLIPETLGSPDIAPSADGSIGLEWVPESGPVHKLFFDIGPGQQWRTYWTTRKDEFGRRSGVSFNPNTRAILQKLFGELSR
jgi:CheY-like chemotaxis protein